MTEWTDEARKIREAERQAFRAGWITGVARANQNTKATVANLNDEKITRDTDEAFPAPPPPEPEMAETVSGDVWVSEMPLGSWRIEEAAGQFADRCPGRGYQRMHMTLRSLPEPEPVVGVSGRSYRVRDGSLEMLGGAMHFWCPVDAVTLSDVSVVAKLLSTQEAK